MIIEKQGDLLESGCDIICHQVNCRGVMGSGIAKQIRAKWPRVYMEYAYDCSIVNWEDSLGSCLLLDTPSNQWVANLFGQNGYGRDKMYTDYAAVESALIKMKDRILQQVPADRLATLRIGIPYGMGCGLGGGSWDIVYAIIKKVFENSQYVIEIWRLN